MGSSVRGFWKKGELIGRLSMMTWAKCRVNTDSDQNAVLPPMFVAACFSFGTGAAKDIQTIMLTRFFSG